MNIENPYQAPKAEIEKKEKLEYCKLSLFSIHERLGRLRFLMHFNLLLIFLMLNVFALSISIIFLLALVPITFVLAVIFVCSIIKRLHDFNIGILKVTLFIALSLFLSYVFTTHLKLAYIFLIFFISSALFIVTGTTGKNTFDFPPPPNTPLVYFLSLFPPVIFFLLMRYGLLTSLIDKH